jgi:ABC-type enterobactin transport system permease subunit
VTVIVTLVLEHCFTIAKILGSIIGCLVVAFLCYELSDVTPMNTRLIITGVLMTKEREVFMEKYMPT